MTSVMRRPRARWTAALVSLAVVAAGCGDDDDDQSSSGSDTTTETGGGSGGGATGTVTIGLEESQSGDCSAFGIPPASAVKLAVQEINDAGGFEVDGTTYTLDLVERDDRCEPSSVIANMTELVEDEGIKFVFGPTTSALANQASEITVANEVLHFSAAGSWQTLGYLSDDAKPLLFGTQVPLSSLADVQAEGMIEIGGPDAVFGILSQDDDTSAGNVPPVVEALEAAGHRVVDIRFPPDATDFTSFLTRMKSEGVDVLFYFYPQARAAEVISLALQLDVAPGGFATRNVDPAIALEGAIGEPLPVPFFSAQGTPSFAYPPNDRVAEYAETLKAFAPNMPLTGANSSFYMYDFVYMLVEAMKAAGTVDDPTAVAEALRELTYEGAAGTVCFAEDQRTAIYDTGLVFVRDGEVESKTRESECAG